MTSSDNTYNGYQNSETCTVCLWLNNDQAHEQAWIEEPEEVRAEAPDCQQVKEGIWTAPQAERFLLADALKNDAGEPLSSERPVAVRLGLLVCCSLRS